MIDHVPESMRWAKVKHDVATRLQPMSREEISSCIGRPIRESDLVQMLRVDHIRVNVLIRMLGPGSGNHYNEYR